MIDYTLLQQTISASGMKREYIAGRLGITRQAFAMKVLGNSEFTTSELTEFKSLLNLSNTTFRRIFFANKVELSSTTRKEEQ